MFEDFASVSFLSFIIPFHLSSSQTPFTVLVGGILTEVVIRDGKDKRVNRKDVKAELWESGHVKGETAGLGQNPGNPMVLGTQISKGRKFLLHRVKFPECIWGVRVHVS